MDLNDAVFLILKENDFIYKVTQTNSIHYFIKLREYTQGDKFIVSGCYFDNVKTCVLFSTWRLYLVLALPLLACLRSFYSWILYHHSNR
jgi:hypothetical protein